MKVILASCLLFVVAFASPVHDKQQPKYGNPDEWSSYVGGDMRFKNPNERNGLSSESYRWTNAQIIYSYSSDFQESKRDIVEEAMISYHNLTNGCVGFKLRTTEVDFVEYTGIDEDDCFSYVGRIGGKQQLNYAQSCLSKLGSVQHEMLHAFGFQHEQCSPDRDTYLVIQWENINSGDTGKFVKCDYSQCTTFNQPYDYSSVMHFSSDAYTKNGNLTIVTIDTAQQNVIGQRVGLSELDITKLMLMYNCP